MYNSKFFNLGKNILPLAIGIIGLGLAGFTCKMPIQIQLPVSEEILKIKFELDSLASILLIVVTLLSSIVLSYSARYLTSDTTRIRFLFQMISTIISVMFFILASNLFTAFIAWQWIGFNLYLLLNHYHYQSEANRAAKKKFIINRVGDMCFLLAIVLCYQFYGTSEYQEIAVLTSNQLKIMNFDINSHSLILGLIFIAIITKSAQFPFYFWLPDTMQTPTPVSALMHAGVINAGGILLARLSISLTQASLIPYLVLSVGITSMIVGGIMKQIQPDIKRKLAYSTMSQMGYMLMQSGLGCFAAAVFHLIAHGFYKAALFLNAGSNIFTNVKYKINKNKQLSSFIQSLILTLIILGIASAAAPAQSSLLMLTFIGISLHQMIITIVQNNRFVLKALALAIIQMILICYYELLNAFEAWVQLPKLHLIDENIEYILSAITTIGYIISSLLCTDKSEKGIWLRTYHHKLIQFLRVEQHLRCYLLTPIRWLGDWLNQHLINHKLKKRLTAVLFLLAPFSSITLSYFNLSDTIMINYILITEIIICLLMANRVRNLLKLVMLLIMTHVCFLALDYSYMRTFKLEMIFSYLTLFLGLIWLVSQKNVSHPKNQVIMENRLSLWGVYLAISLFFLIGIPGTAAFIFWFNIISNMTHDILITIGLMITNILMSIVVLHALQDHVFNLKDSHEIADNKKLHAHMIFSGVILSNIYLGIF